MDKVTESKILGVFSEDKKVYLLLSIYDGKRILLQLNISSDGYHFRPYHEFSILDSGKKPVNLSDCTDFRISKFDKDYILTYKSRKKKTVLSFAVSRDFSAFKQQPSNKNAIAETGMVVPKYRYRNKFVLLFGDKNLSLAYSDNYKKWIPSGHLLLTAPPDILYKTGSVWTTVEGLLFIYQVIQSRKGTNPLYLKIALLDKNYPEKILWKTDDPIWTCPPEWTEKEINFIGVVNLKGKLISYWYITGEGLIAVDLPSVRLLLDWRESAPSLFLNRIRENPILKPIAGHFWESKAVFNTAAVYGNGKVHLVYRAIGDHDISVLGYASSSDGIHIDERLDKPIFSGQNSPELIPSGTAHYYSPYISGGGGSGGCEDPRITKLGDRFYMTYVHYDGRNPPRVALTSISNRDFLGKKWNWSEPVLISPPGVVDKNACILPEKINNKYVIFHRIFPNILIDFVDDLDFDGKTKWLKGEYTIKPRRNFWDSRKVGMGGTPIKTDDGWLAIYQAVGDDDPGRYKIGAMLLDLKDPTKVSARSNNPILEPVERYENEGMKRGVVYPCGAVSMNDRLYVYYGGADMVVCAAYAEQEKFINQLKYTGSAMLKPVKHALN